MAFRVWVVICICWIGFAAEAAEEVWRTLPAKSGDFTFYVLYDENGEYAVDTFTQHLSQFQRKIEHRTFHSRREQLAHLPHKKIRASARSFLTTRSISEITGAVIWPTTQAWNKDWEKKYSDWITQNVDSGFFQRHQIATDCADVAISLRWIFARLNGLPMASSLAGSGRLFTNESVLSQWKTLPQSHPADDWSTDTRFLAALNYVLDNTYTHSLMADSYPVAIQPSTFSAGVHHLDLYSGSSGHTLLVNHIDTNLGGVFVLYSDVPRAVRVLHSDYYTQEEADPNLNDGGFLRIRWAQKNPNGPWSLTPREQMPDYSLEQYSTDFMRGYSSFSDAVEGHLGATMPPANKISAVMATLLDHLNSRRDLVKQGFAFCQKNNCAPGTSNYENWGTPNRDDAIAQLIQFAANKAWEYGDPEEQWQNFNFKQNFEIEGVAYPMHDILNVFSTQAYSSDPRDPILKRWGGSAI